MRTIFCWAIMLTALPVVAAERQFKFGEYPLDQTPPGFRSVVAGQGKPGEWKVLLDDAPSQFPPLNSNAPSMTKRAVLAQLARDPTDVHFPMLVFDGETFGDFRLETRFKIMGGALEQMAGVVFRFQNESNFYVARASALGRNIRCYKVENGVLKPPFGPELEIGKGIWHDLAVECEGNRIRCLLDGKEVIKLIDNSGTPGKIGFWTKSDSVSYFTDAKVVYTPQETLAQTLVNDALKTYPRLVGLKIFAVRQPGKEPEIIASKDKDEIGQPGGQAEQDVISSGNSYFSRGRGTVTVIAALRDHNGDPVAAVRVVMKSFPGETQDTAIGKAQPVVQQMKLRVPSLTDLLK